MFPQAVAQQHPRHASCHRSACSVSRRSENVLQLLLITLQYHTTTPSHKNVFLIQNGQEQDKLLEIYSVGGEKLNVNWVSNRLNAALGYNASCNPHFRLIGACGECYDPQLADTEMGITVMDLSTPTPKYCLMFRDLKSPLDAASYAHHWDWQSPMESERARLTKMVSELEKFQVLTVAECKEIFPGLYEVSQSSANDSCLFQSAVAFGPCSRLVL